MNKKLHVAIVGLGKMGLLHAGILSFLPNAELVAFCEKSAMIRRFLKKTLNQTEVVSDVAKLSGLDLDAVYVTTPITSHFPVVKAVLLDKISSNIFVEKTLTSSSEEAKELCELARKFGGVTMVGYQRRFSVTYKKAKELLDQNIIGEPVSFNAYAFSSDFFGSEADSKAHAARVGALRDLGCHAIDVALWFFGDMQVESVKFEAFSSISFVCTTSDGLEGKFDVSQSMENYRMPEVGFRIRGSLGTIEVTDDKVYLRLKNGKTFKWYRHDLNDNVAFLLGASEYFREDEYFIKSILRGHSVEPNFNTDLKVERLIDQIKEKSSETECRNLNSLPFHNRN